MSHAQTQHCAIGSHVVRRRKLTRYAHGCFTVAGIAQVHEQKVTFDLCFQLIRCAIGDNGAVVDDDHAFRHRIRLIEVMRGQEDSDAVLFAQSHDMVPEVRPALGVEPGGRFVQEYQFGAVYQAHRDVETAPLATREAGHVPLGLSVEVELTQQLLGADVRLLAPDAVQPRLQRQFFTDTKTIKRPVTLSYQAYPAANLDLLAHDVESRNRRRAGCRWQQGCEHAQGRRLTRAIRPEKGNDFARGNINIDPADCFDYLVLRLKTLSECGCVNHGDSYRCSSCWVRSGSPRGAQRGRPPEELA